MIYSEQHIRTFHDDGVLFFPGLLSLEAIELLRSETEKMIETSIPGTIKEKGKDAIRSLHGCHLRSEIFMELVCHTAILGFARQVLEEAYVHQFKINLKSAFEGERWPWHQDSIYLWKEDQIPTPNALNAAIFLDEVNEFNGPLYLIPRSHRQGIVDIEAQLGTSQTKLKYELPHEIVSSMIAEQGIISPKGPAGSVLFFHSSVVHGSAENMSPFNRHMAIAIYNGVDNSPQAADIARPEYFASQDYRPLIPSESKRLTHNKKLTFL